MLRIVLQRFAVQRSIAEQLEAVPLDEVLRRMQSSSLSNPARSLEAHFVLAEASDKATNSVTSPSASTPAAAQGIAGATQRNHADPLRTALSERLLAEVRSDMTTSHLGLDSGSLMLANCLRHRLSPLATQQIFALWLKYMHQSASARASHAPSGRGSMSVLGLGRSGGGGGSAQDAQLTQFQCLVRVMEACLDAREQTNVTRFPEGHKRREAVAASPNPVCFTLDDWAELIDTVEQFWPLFADYGASTTSLLVQFTSLALELSGQASATPATAEPGSRFANSLRRLSHLQTDRTLLQTRVFGLCAEAVKSLCEVDANTNEGDEEVDSPRSTRRNAPWWHRPQELVRLSHARRRLDVFEAQQFQRANTTAAVRSASTTAGAHDPAAALHADSAHRSPAAGGVAARQRGEKGGEASAATVRSSRLGGSAASSSSRWMPRLSPSSWWSSAASLAGAGATAAAAGGTASAALRVGRQLGGYVTYQALKQTATPPAAGKDTDFTDSCGVNVAARSANQRSRISNSSVYASSPAVLSVSLGDVLEIFSTVCTTASSSDALSHVTTFSWWVRDVIHQQYGRRSLHSLRDLSSLLGVAELCLAYPDGTQTVLAEIMKCLQRSALLLWQAGDTQNALFQQTEQLPVNVASSLWPRACEVVANTLPLTTVRTEADRTLRVLVTTAQQSPSVATPTSEEQGDASLDADLLLCHRRYGVLVLACLLLQRPNGYVTPAFATQIRELVLAVPFALDARTSTELAAVVRALYVFTHPGLRNHEGKRAMEDWKKREVVPYLLDSLSRLLSPPAEAQESSTSAQAAPANLASSLSTLSSVERQLLRSALREVRQWTAAPASASVRSVVQEHLFSPEKQPKLKRPSYVPDEKGVSAQVSAAAAAATHPFPLLDVDPAHSSDMPTRVPAKLHADALPRLPSDDGRRQSSEEHVLQREIEAVSRHFTQRKSVL